MVSPPLSLSFVIQIDLYPFGKVDNFSELLAQAMQAHIVGPCQGSLIESFIGDLSLFSETLFNAVDDQDL